MEISDPLNITGGRVYNSKGNLMLDGTVDLTGGLNIKGQSPSNQNFKIYAGNIGSPIPGNRLIFADTNLGDARYWFDSSSGSSAISVASGGSEEAVLGYVTENASVGGTGVILGLYQNNNFTITNSTATATTPLFTVKNSGNVGIGTTSPVGLLEVAGTGNPSISVTTTTAGNTANIGLNNPGRSWSLNVRGDLAENMFSIKDETAAGAPHRLVVDSSGNVGIGTTSPQSLLSVGSGSEFRVNNSGTISSATGITSSGQITFSGLTAIGPVIANAGGIISSESQLSISMGGTGGASSPTSGAVAFGNGTQYLFNVPGASDQLLVSGGTGAPVFMNLRSLLTPGTDISFSGTTNVTINNTSTLATVTGRGATTGTALTVSALGDALNLSGAGANLNFSGAGLAQIKTAASQNLALMAGGNVGIGTTNPTQKLDVLGNLNISTGSTYKINGTDVLSSTTLGSGIVNSSLTGVGALTSGSIAGGFGSITTTNTIATMGNVGVGTTGPLNALDVSGSVAFGSLPGGPLPQANSAYFSGNVGIGITGPISMLTISKGTITNANEGNPGDSTVLIRQNTNNLGASALEFGYGATGTFATARLVANVISGGGGDFRIQTTAGSAGPYATRIYVGSTGNVGIGTTLPTQALDVTGTIHASNLAGAGTTLETDGNGNIIRTPSDIKLKENIVPVAGALSKVLSLQGVYYKWRDKARFGTQDEIGFIAQDVQKVVPEVVRGGGEYLSLNYGNLTAVLAEAVKEVNGKVDENGNILSQSQAQQNSLEQKIADAQAQIDTINQQIGLHPSGDGAIHPTGGIDVTVNSRLDALEQSSASLSAALASQTGQSVGLVESVASRVSFLESLLFARGGAPETTSSALVNSQLSAVNGQVSIDSNVVAYADLNVMGRTAVADLYATGRVTLGLLTLDSADNSINSLGGELKLQSSAISAAVNVFNGKVVMLPNGDITTAGTVTADKVKTNELAVGKVSVSTVSSEVVDSSSFIVHGGTGANQASSSALPSTMNQQLTTRPDPTIGSTVIPAGQTSVLVTNNSVTNNSLIFATPSEPVAVGTKKNSGSFMISIKEVLGEDLKVNWWIIN